jgi:hypothetical protein
MVDYPNVPNNPGVPPVPRNGSNANPATPPPVSSDGSGNHDIIDGPQWGIFNADMTPAIIGDSVVSEALVKESKISSYPVEAPDTKTGQAGFQSYNKVQMPFQARVAISQAGDVATRQAFMDAVDAAYQSLTLYSVVTPEKTYTSANVVHYSFDRDVRQTSRIVADIWLEEVRTTATATLSATANPLSAAQTDTGAVQGNAPTPAQSQSVTMQGG